VSDEIEIELTVNGAPVAASVAPSELLLDFLRERLDLRGAKRSCDVQVCGTCTVLVDGGPVSACTYLAYEARGKRVLTIEGLAESPEELHPLRLRTSWRVPDTRGDIRLRSQRPRPWLRQSSARSDIPRSATGFAFRCDGSERLPARSFRS